MQFWRIVQFCNPTYSLNVSLNQVIWTSGVFLMLFFRVILALRVFSLPNNIFDFFALTMSRLSVLGFPNLGRFTHHWFSPFYLQLSCMDLDGEGTVCKKQTLSPLIEFYSHIWMLKKSGNDLLSVKYNLTSQKDMRLWEYFKIKNPFLNCWYMVLSYLTHTKTKIIKHR